MKSIGFMKKPHFKKVNYEISRNRRFRGRR